MNKAELVALVSEKVDLTKKSTEEVINILFDTISETLETGEKVVIPARVAVTVKAGSKLKDALN